MGASRSFGLLTLGALGRSEKDASRKDWASTSFEIVLVKSGT